MTSIIAIILSLVPIIEGSSRYFIYTFSNPFSDSSNVPYPLDVCIIYGVTIHRFRPVYNHAIFTCNADNDGIIMTTYGSDSACASEGTVDNTYSVDSFNKTGDLYSFNCMGENNYVEAFLYQNDATCCGSYIASKIATNVCYPQDGGRYLMSICDAEGSASAYISHNATCNDDNTTTKSTTFNECQSKSEEEKLYVRLNTCVQNGTVITESTYCASESTSTTKRGNNGINTPSPTTTTVRPSTAPTAATNNTLFGNVTVMKVIFGGCIVVVMIGIGIYCCIKMQRKPTYKKREGLIEAGHGNLERIALDYVVENDREDERQQIVGSAEEIDIAAVDPIIPGH